jgi:hypothetical protein
MAAIRLLIVDACVLIDFVKADPAILTLVSCHVGDVHVATPVFEEVRDIDATMVTSLGIKLYEPSLELAAVAAEKRGRLSFQDRLCLAIARIERWTCVSNDRQLRAACEEATVPVLWGFQVLALLVDARALTASDARMIATNIAATNKRIGPEVLARFLAKLRAK